MREEHRLLIKQKYKEGDSVALFRAVLSVAGEVGLDEALACLEECVVEKRSAWLDENLESQERTGEPVYDGFRIFYEVYLGISPPEDGEIVERTGGQITARWWNRCPTLEACEELGLDTREVCRKAYHRPVQVFLSRVDAGLIFERSYECIRPRAPYCEETIRIADEP